jgi:hypothetical protein
MMGNCRIGLSLILVSIVLLIACKAKLNECEIYFSDSLIMKKIDSIEVLLYKKSLYRSAILGKKKLRVDFGDLGSTDGTLLIVLFKNGMRHCEKSYYFTNGYVLFNRFMLMDSAGICSISIDPEHFP